MTILLTWMHDAESSTSHLVRTKHTTVIKLLIQNLPQNISLLELGASTFKESRCFMNSAYNMVSNTKFIINDWKVVWSLPSCKLKVHITFLFWWFLYIVIKIEVSFHWRKNEFWALCFEGKCKHSDRTSRVAFPHWASKQKTRTRHLCCTADVILASF